MSEQQPAKKQEAPFSVAELGATPFTGTWAFRASLPIVWHNWAVVPELRDNVRLVGKIERVGCGDNVYTDCVSLSALQFPPWTYRSPEHKHRVVFSDDLFDRGYFPQARADIAQMLHGPQAGLLKSSMVALFAGVTTQSPEAADWCYPQKPDLGAWTIIDSDLDGIAGISAVLDEQNGYSPIATIPRADVVATRLGLGARLRFKYEVWPNSKDEMSGRAYPVTSQGPEGKDRNLWPDFRVFAAKTYEKKSGRVGAATPAQVRWLNAFLNPRADETREGHFEMWRTAPHITGHEIRQRYL